MQNSMQTGAFNALPLAERRKAKVDAVATPLSILSLAPRGVSNLAKLVSENFGVKKMRRLPHTVFMDSQFVKNTNELRLNFS